MAILSPQQLQECRQGVSKEITVNYTKSQINLALQAIEDFFEANRVSLSNAINTATSPFVFTNAQKKKLVAYWALKKFDIEKA